MSVMSTEEHMTSRRPFRQRLTGFFRDVWKSILLLLIVGAATAGIWLAPHAFNRHFPIIFFAGSKDIVWTRLAFPYQEPIFSSLAAALVAILIPIATILVSQIWIRDFCSAAYAILGLIYSMMSGTFIVVVLKKTIGGLRPHFLEVCKPVIADGTIGAGFKNCMFTVDQVCTGKDRKRIGAAIESFPSGHSEAAFAGLLYLAIYLFAHLRFQNIQRASYWRMMACVLPVLLAMYISSTLVLGYQHHSYDVIFGAAIGVAMALLSYRIAFVSIWDKRFNMVPVCGHNHGNEADGRLPG